MESITRYKQAKEKFNKQEYNLIKILENVLQYFSENHPEQDFRFNVNEFELLVKPNMDDMEIKEHGDYITMIFVVCDNCGEYELFTTGGVGSPLL